MKKERKASGEGRNSKLFNKVRTRYYDQMEKFESYDELIEDVTECVTHHNKEGLSVREAKGIAKSIAKYCWKNRIKMMEKRRKEVLTTEEIRCRQSMGGKQKSVVANDTLVKSIYYFIDNGITKIKQREFVNQSELSLRYVQTNWGMITHSLSTGDTSFLSLSSSTTCSDPYNVVKDSITSSLGSIQSLVCHSTPSNPDSPIPRASFMLH